MRTTKRLNLLLSSVSAAPSRLRMAIGILAFANLIVPAVLSNFDYSATQLVLAMVLLDICLFPTLRYLLHPEGLPILPVLCLAYATQYALPIFTQEPGVPVAYGFRYLEDSDVVAALGLAILGACVLQICYYSLNYRKAVKLLPHVNLPLDPKRSDIFCVAIFILSIGLGRLDTILSDQTFLQFSAIIGLLQNQLLVAISILSWLMFTGRANRFQRILLYVIVGTTAIKGFSTTMMETIMVPLAVLFISKWFYSRRLPISMLLVIGVAFLFLSPVKKDIRSAIVEDRTLSTDVSATTRGADWINQSLNYWSEAFSGKRDLVESTTDASSRTDLIHTFALIYSMTPEVVPYQYGDSYSYLAVGWIPRAIWPEKPLANAANNFFAIAYEVSTEEGVKTSSFGATLIGEGFMNFGVPGVVLVMAFLGLITALLEDVFAGKESGPGGRAIFLATFVYFLNGIGSSAELMFGGIVQNMAASVVLLWWARARPQKATSHSRGGLIPAAASYRSLTP
jgi:hypothetical protein